jgi:hypothetical protein
MIDGLEIGEFVNCQYTGFAEMVQGWVVAHYVVFE